MRRACAACGRPLPLDAHPKRKYCVSGCEAKRCRQCGAETYRRWTLCRRCARIGTEPISPRERAVLECVATGMTNAQIGAALYVSPKTVENHLWHLSRRLGVHGRAALVATALRKGLIL